MGRRAREEVVGNRVRSGRGGGKNINDHQNRVLRTIGGIGGVGVCTSNFVFEYFLALEEFLVFKGIFGLTCAAVASCWGVEWFFFTDFVTRSLLAVTAVFLALTLPHIYAIAHVRGLQQHSQNVERRLRAPDPVPSPSEKGARCWRVKSVVQKTVLLLSPMRAKSALHVTLLTFFRIAIEYIDISTDIGAGVLFLRLGYKSTLPLQSVDVLAFGVLGFAVLDTFPFAVRYALPPTLFSERFLLWLYGVSVFCEFLIFVFTIVLIQSMWTHFGNEDAEASFIILDILSTAFGILTGLVVMYVNGLDSRLKTAKSQVTTSLRRLQRTLTNSSVQSPRKSPIPSPSRTPVHLAETAQIPLPVSDSTHRGVVGFQTQPSLTAVVVPSEDGLVPATPQLQQQQQQHSQSARTLQKEDSEVQKRNGGLEDGDRTSMDYNSESIHIYDSREDTLLRLPGGGTEAPSVGLRGEREGIRVAVARREKGKQTLGFGYPPRLPHLQTRQSIDSPSGSDSASLSSKVVGVNEINSEP
uniref:Uncharacterized protein n=1 Tax=Chromera velia CCMP2878 TaxID=1169474 RepID=A0A0G4G1B4_9ALVE|eukprot:Cvel_19757.t1-p1 / transcript=Cvel_19757.t1 / gene=Cvel_19757 / organism=Chromera_velia_CCMP2878 / gene_product=hypothetical protein / transcript_product=hypothetical protein / location=Cvel_scaffold1730:24071-25642(+) / protein_length=524 / sequence_SO=supercontig / SO=protein_coding / is_pseudo=false